MVTDVFFSSDFHYAHKNLVSGISEWTNKARCRKFKTLEEHNETLVNNINNVVKPKNTLYFLGDWSFGGIDNILKFRKLIRCENIHFILGNHDDHIYSRQSSLLGGGSHGFLSIDYYKKVKIDKQSICLFHFPCRGWDKAAKGTWMLHGHCHGTLASYSSAHIEGSKSWFKKTELFKTMDVGIDTHPKFQPYAFETIRDIMNKRINLIGIDHHGKDDN